MGTTLHAIIQRFSPANEWAVDFWHEVATFELNKYYEGMRWLHERAHPGWPVDRGSHESSEYEFCGEGAGQRYWGDVALMRRASEALDSSTVTAMHAAMQVLVTLRPVRVLFYEM
jgi:hypothetical protein